jgi:hypothetical protein
MTTYFEIIDPTTGAIQGRLNECTYNENNVHDDKQIYYTHDNMSRPFMITLTKDMIRVYKSVDPDDEDNYDKIIYNITPYDKLFIGGDPANLEFVGNSILIKTADLNYVFVGHQIFSFETSDEIIQYFSPVGNSDVPYPYAIGTKYTYLLVYDQFIANSEIDPNADPYAQELAKEKVFYLKKMMIHDRI